MNRETNHEKKKMDPVIKILLIMAVGGVIGGLGGFIIGFTSEFFEFSSLGDMMNSLVAKWAGLRIWGLVIVTVASVVAGEILIDRLKKIGEQILNAEDEEADELEFEEERVGAWAMSLNVIGQGLAILIFATGYSLDYVETEGIGSFLLCCGIFLLCAGYLSVNQMRFVKLVKKSHPEKKGDPASVKFQKEWLESCDEAERELIYQSAYRTFQMSNQLTPILMFVATILHLMFQTGLLAILIPLVLWVTSILYYNKSVVDMKRKKMC